MHLFYHSNNFWKAPGKSSCVSVLMTFVTATFDRLNCLMMTTSELREKPKVTGNKVWTIWRVRSCLDAHLWQGWSGGLVHYSRGNATDSIWRVLASSDGISSWTPLKAQHNSPNPNPLVNKLCCIDFLTQPTPLIIPYRLPAFLESLMPLKNWCSIHARYSKSSLKHSIRFCGGIFCKFQTGFYCILFF